MDEVVRVDATVTVENTPLVPITLDAITFNAITLDANKLDTDTDETRTAFVGTKSPPTDVVNT
jgi:hypothetical protein